MRSYVVKVVAYEFVTIEANNEEQAIDKACEKFGENIEIDDTTEIVEFSKEW